MVVTEFSIAEMLMLVNPARADTRPRPAPEREAGTEEGATRGRWERGKAMGKERPRVRRKERAPLPLPYHTVHSIKESSAAISSFNKVLRLMIQPVPPHGCTVRCTALFKVWALDRSLSLPKDVCRKAQPLVKSAFDQASVCIRRF